MLNKVEKYNEEVENHRQGNKYSKARYLTVCGLHDLLHCCKAVYDLVQLAVPLGDH